MQSTSEQKVELILEPEQRICSAFLSCAEAGFILFMTETQMELRSTPSNLIRNRSVITLRQAAKTMNALRVLEEFAPLFWMPAMGKGNFGSCPGHAPIDLG